MKTEKTYPCLNCGKITPDSSNFCDWNCHIELAVKDGGVKHQPNGLPIACIKANNSMWEHEHGDHPDYKFPVELEWNENWNEDQSLIETHAFIYTDGHIALTLYECQYIMWSLYSRKILYGDCDTGERLTEESRRKILEYFNNGKS